MSMEIDYDNPEEWTQEEVDFLKDRPWRLGKYGLTPEILTQVQARLDGEDEGIPEQDEEKSEVSYYSLTNNQLRDLLVYRDLSPLGNKAELVARLEAHDQQEEDHTDDNEGEDEEDEEDNEGEG